MKQLDAELLYYNGATNLDDPERYNVGGKVLDIEAAAKALASAMDYPWEHMPEQGREEMRKHAEAVIEAAMPKP